MDVEFALQESDLVALARYRMEHSPRRVRRYRLGWLGLTGAFAAGAVALYLSSLRAPAYYLGAFAAFFLVFYPYYYRWLVGRTLRRIVAARSNPEAFTHRSLRATPEAIVIDGGKQTTVGWQRVTDVALTPERAFVAVDGEYAIVLPKSAIGDERFQPLVDLIRAASARAVQPPR
jgi:hypothetical protein